MIKTYEKAANQRRNKMAVIRRFNAFYHIPAALQATIHAPASTPNASAHAPPPS